MSVPVLFLISALAWSQIVRDGHVYFNGHLVSDADPKTFAIVRKNAGSKNVIYYAKDKRHVFYSGGFAESSMHVLPNADPNSFEVLDQHSYAGAYARDNKSVYYGDQLVAGADPKHFVDKAPYGHDGKSVYLYGKKIPGADPATFKPLDIGEKNFEGITGFAKDDQHVFFNQSRVVGADPETFAAVEGRDDLFEDIRSHYSFATVGKTVIVKRDYDIGPGAKIFAQCSRSQDSIWIASAKYDYGQEIQICGITCKEDFKALGSLNRDTEIGDPCDALEVFNQKRSLFGVSGELWSLAYKKGKGFVVSTHCPNGEIPMQTTFVCDAEECRSKSSPCPKK